MLDKLYLPAHSHAYVAICDPPNSTTFVQSEPQDIARHLVAVAAGIVQFDKNGFASVKVANLADKPTTLHRDRVIATMDTLPALPTTMDSVPQSTTTKEHTRDLSLSPT